METKRIEYPVGVETFSEIRERGYIYIDKTAYIEELLTGGKYIFISRPRRFGKSLLISTMEAYFQGRRELFKGLAIDRDDVDWNPRPVFRLVLNGIDPKSEDSLSDLLEPMFSQLEEKYGSKPSEKGFAQRFEGLLERAFLKTGRKVAVLVDEYDAPLLDTLEKPELNDSYRSTLKSLFTVLKRGDRFIHFALLTGVSRFSHTSLFSGANNVPDRSLDNKFAAICGITQQELENTLRPGILNFADKNGFSYEQALATLKENYDGYHFTDCCPDIYNPYSILRTLQQEKIDDFWFQTGTPSYLLKILKRDSFFLPDMDCIQAFSDELSATESFANNPITLLFETGYLTIKGYDPDSTLYTLGIPNKEVAKGLAGSLLPIYSDVSQETVKSWIKKMTIAVTKGDADDFIKLVKTFLAGNPYSNTELKKRETYFKNNLYLIFKLLGFNPQTEEETCHSRSDIILKTRRFIYILELKVDGTPEEAMAQIKANGYAEPYMLDGRKIIQLGVNYSSKENNIDSWLVE